MLRRAKVSRFKLRDSDRSGFTVREITLVRDKGRLVAPEEFDQPPPSLQSLGGEGDVSGMPRTTVDQFTVAFTSAAAVEVLAVQAGVSITPTLPDPSDHTGNTIQGYLAVVGSLAPVTMAVTPQITAGRERQVLSVECVGSGVTFVHGSGLSLMAGRRFSMQSGSVITFQYNSANGAWSETSRTP